MARARIDTMKQYLIGKDPLLIEVHFQNLTSLIHTYMAHIPTISGIDMALWDLAGKITGIARLQPARRTVSSIHSHVLARRRNEHARQEASCQRFRRSHQGDARGIHGVQDRYPSRDRCADWALRPTLDSAQLRNVARAYHNAREALGEEIDVAVHCHNELDNRAR